VKKRLSAFVRSSTFRLAVSYLAIIMTLSIGFSAVFYTTSSVELDKKPAPGYSSSTHVTDPDHEFDQWLRTRAADGRATLAMNLVFVNLIALLLGGTLSYFLARRTLKPIEEAMEAQDRFIADASHELRTPLTSLLLNNEVTLRKKQLTIEGARRSIEQNVSDLEQLRELSDHLLDLVVSGSDQAVKKEIVISAVIDTAIGQVAPMAIKKHITIHNSAEAATMKANESKLVKLLVILLDNAIKYSADKREINVTFEDTEKNATILVRDKGYGMTKADLDHIFDRFYRADQSRSQVLGHGLGLSIAAKLIHELGGTLRVESELGRGSSFRISLPK
jgi:two-component system sensor histidine kinase CiaH